MLKFSFEAHLIGYETFAQATGKTSTHAGQTGHLCSPCNDSLSWTRIMHDALPEPTTESEPGAYPANTEDVFP